MKDLLERYLTTVSRELPDAQRTDITAELRDVLLSQIEAKEESLGRPLNRDELEAVLTGFGHPLAVAGRYRKVQHLIGPEIFPFWWAALKVSLVILAGVYVVLVTLRIAFDGSDDAGHYPDLSNAVLITFGAVTLVAAGMERLNLTRYLYRWRPRDLPPVNSKLKSRFETVVEIGMGIGFLLWWFGVVHFRNWLPMIPAEVSIRLGPIFHDLFWPIAAFMAFEVLAGLLQLTQRAWARTNAAFTLARSILGAILVSIILQAGHWVAITGHLPRQGALAGMEYGFDSGLRIGLVATVAILIIKAAFDGRRLWRAIQDAEATASP